MSTDKEWEKWGKNDPYYGVLTDNKFRRKNLTQEQKKVFFESGVRDINHVLETVRYHLDPNFSPRKALDFGCGTGRIVIPLSKIAENVVGVDVSESMLREAYKNCEEQCIKNVRFVKSDDTLSCLNESFNFIHSIIVFQHIPTNRGKKIFLGLLDRLEENGICAIQLTYASSKYQSRFGKPFFKLLRRLLRKPKRFLFGLFKRLDPVMEMNKYDLNDLFFIMQRSGITNFYAEYTDHGGELGVFLYFNKKRKELL